MCEVPPAGSDLQTLLMDLATGDQAIAGQQHHFTGLARRAFLLLDQYGTDEPDDEYIIETINKFDNATILDQVGFDKGSVSSFLTRLKKITSLIPAANKPTADRFAQRLLDALGKESPTAIAHEATVELKCTAANRQFVIAGTTNRDYDAIVNHFEPLWDSYVKKGKIPRKAAGSKPRDASMLSMHTDEGA